jgi:hypothetical protein
MHPSTVDVRILSLAFAGFFVGYFVVPAAANNFGSYVTSADETRHHCDDSLDAECVANNNYHLVDLEYVAGKSMKSAFDAEIVVYDAETQLTVDETTCSSCDDVFPVQAPYGNTGWYAVTFCATGASYGGTDPSRWCKPQIIEVNTTGTWDGTLEGRESTACHEMGHSVGLRHTYDTTSCMLNGQLHQIEPNSHDVLMINNHY